MHRKILIAALAAFVVTAEIARPTNTRVCTLRKTRREDNRQDI